MKKSFIIGIAILSLFMLQACVSTIVGAVVDTTIEVVKIPFKVGGAIIDAASNKDEKKEEKAAETGTLGASVSQGQIRVTTAATVAAKPWHNSKPWMSE